MSRISSIFNMTCPRCRESKLFEHPMHFSRPLKMNKQCPQCGQKFEPELGFYYGAMFISYIFVGFFSLGLTSLLVFYFNLSIEVTFTILIGILAVMFCGTFVSAGLSGYTSWSSMIRMPFPSTSPGRRRRKKQCKKLQISPDLPFLDYFNSVYTQSTISNCLR